jgi:hypothetical protein
LTILKFSFQDSYHELHFSELLAIKNFMDRNDPAALGRLIEQNDQLTPDFRRFIADLVIGKIKRPMKKASTFSRDLEIYQEIENAMCDGQTLIAITRIIADRIFLTNSAIDKANYRGKSAYEVNDKVTRKEESQVSQKLETD